MKRCFWSIADNNNMKYYKMMEASFRKFHPTEELILFDEKAIKEANDSLIFYRATPYFTKQLFAKGYDEICKLDADQIITGSLDAIWEGDYDVAVVNNSNPREMQAYTVSVLNINPLAYANCGFVVMKSKAFVDYWDNFNRSIIFNSLQFKEQDILNIMIFSNNYKVRKLDEDDSYYGLASKGYWPEIVLKDEALVLLKGEEWPDKDKIIRCIHWAGGNSPDKMNYKIRFSEEVVARLDELIKVEEVK